MCICICICMCIYIYMYIYILQGKAKGTPSGVKTLFSAWHAYPSSSKWNSGVQDHFCKMLKYMFLVSLQWNSGSTTHNQAQGTHIKWQARWCKSQWNSASRRIVEKFSKFWRIPMELRFSRSLLPASHVQGSVINSQWNSGFTDLVCIAWHRRIAHKRTCVILQVPV